MYVDLHTLYLLIIGTLLASAGMIFWELRAHPLRSKTLRLLGVGFATLAAGCVLILFRRELPGAYGAALSNLVVLSGYLLVLNGVASLRGRQYRGASFGLLAVMALVWAVTGERWLDIVWAYASAVPIALISAMTSLEMLRCRSMQALQPRRIIVVVTGIHALLYAGRAFVLPWMVAQYGQPVLMAASNITMYEGVLYSVILPMTLLKLIREETHGQLLQESQTDYLTRLGNRRWFFEQGARVIGAAAPGPVAVLAFDLDHFKVINDLHGHETGDKVLTSFAGVAQGAAGPGAVLARIGGEEFACLLAGDDARRAHLLAEGIVRRFAETVADPVRGVGVPATVSVGLAQFDDDAPVLAAGLAAADRALYRAKALGGNRVELAGLSASSAAA
ncbi:diguanylate cyclase [Achromobacter sp. UMC46]|uniref:GGDEF domain-containing protein n=1 Tax=Achromobacter sp. UMC46 TaxID=1862319 RepID=UPI0016049E45|nr:GGDEF domain-containing protein [Achromobacter sp. UMC46]MBB1592899.1 diguanylate cyclase [Achromobacter sp. UMC46]